MLDLVKLTLQAGNGGNGRVSFRREKFVPKGGPDGGDGGDGGSVVIVADSHVSTFQHFEGKKKFQAEEGGLGGKQKQSGGKGADTIIKVPLGTVVWLLAENDTSFWQRREPKESPHHIKYFQEKGDIQYAEEVPDASPHIITHLFEKWPPQTPLEAAVMAQPKPDEETEVSILEHESLKGLPFKHLPKLKLVELVADGQSYVVCQGGEGGRGSTHFKSSIKTTPKEAELGTLGEVKIVAFELKLLADVGLVGLPNAGKSTLLSVLTQARPKIAAYPFTTLSPQLGVITIGDRELVMADIPGLIEGASAGKGLGHDFLRHLEHCRVIVWLLTPMEATETESEALWQQYQLLRNEMMQFNSELVTKPQVLCLSKIDLYSPEQIEAIKSYFAAQGHEIVPISSATHKGLTEVQLHVSRFFTD